MNKQNLIRLMGFFSVMLFLAFFSTGSVFAKSDLIRFTVENKSNRVFTMRLEGPQFYYLVVGKDSAEVFTPKRGEYTYTMFSCGAYASGELDLSTQKKMVVPECGTNAGPQARAKNKIDVSKIIKLVKVTIENDTNSNMLAVFTGPGTYVFSLKPGAEDDYTIPRGEYDITVYACGRVGPAKFVARANKTKTLGCPKN